MDYLEHKLKSTYRKGVCVFFLTKVLPILLLAFADITISFFNSNNIGKKKLGNYKIE